MGNMAQASQALLSRIAAQSGAHSATLFVYDRAAQAQAVHYLDNFGLNAETNAAYSKQVCHQDPFLRLAAQQPQRLQLVEQAQAEAASQGAQARDYWEFMHRKGYCESAAWLHPLCGELYLVLGLMRSGGCARETHLNAARSHESAAVLFEQTRAQLLPAALRHYLSACKAQPERLPELSTREREVVSALCRGLSNKCIAFELGLSECTVENYLRRIYRKHGVHNRTSLMAKLA